MTYISPTSATDPEILQQIGRRLRRLRSSRDLTLDEAGAGAGLSAKTVARAEKGDNPTLLTVLRLLRVYGRLSALDQFIPEPDISPMTLIRHRSRTGSVDG